MILCVVVVPVLLGDEIMVINGAIVSDLDMMFIESVLQEEQNLCMMIRSPRSEPPESSSLARTTDDYIESLVCPPPPSDGAISDEMISKLVVPAPWTIESKDGTQARSLSSLKQRVATGQEIADTLLKTAEQVTSECRSSPITAQTVVQPPSFISTQVPLASSQPPAVGVIPSEPKTVTISTTATVESQPVVRRPPLTDAEKMRKVILELVDTERTYLQHLHVLLDSYLEPMKEKKLLSPNDINALFGNILEIVNFQKKFLGTLEDAVNQDKDNYNNYQSVSQFKSVLISLASAFLRYADKFKLYSSFCASHSKAQKILHPPPESGPGGVAQNQALQEFLNTASRGQHAFSLESYLIKPIQRILKYPLLLQQLKHLTDANCEEHRHLNEALKAIERVAEHINEMQRIHEEYGAIFDHLQRQSFKSLKVHIDLSPAELLHYGGVEWLNIHEYLGKIKKGLELHAMCFVFKSAVVFLCKERIRQKKKLVVSRRLQCLPSIKFEPFDNLLLFLLCFRAHRTNCRKWKSFVIKY